LSEKENATKKQIGADVLELFKMKQEQTQEPKQKKLI